MADLHRLEDKKAAEEHHTTRRVRSDYWSGRTGATVEDAGARGETPTLCASFSKKILFLTRGYIFQKWVTFPTAII